MIVITRHAEVRIRERTKLSCEEVKNILEAEAYVVLCSEGEDTHVLIYSQPNGTCFVVVLFDTYMVKTVLYAHHKIPCRVKPKHRKEALEKYRRYVFGRMVGKESETVQQAELQIYILRKKEFSYPLEDILLSKYPDLPALVSNHAELFSIIVNTIEAWLPSNITTKVIRYRFFVKNKIDNRLDERFLFTHKTLKKHLNLLTER